MLITPSHLSSPAWFVLIVRKIFIFLFVMTDCFAGCSSLHWHLLLSELRPGFASFSCCSATDGPASISDFMFSFLLLRFFIFFIWYLNYGLMRDFLFWLSVCCECLLYHLFLTEKFFSSFENIFCAFRTRFFSKYGCIQYVATGYAAIFS